MQIPDEIHADLDFLVRLRPTRTPELALKKERTSELAVVRRLRIAFADVERRVERLPVLNQGRASAGAAS
jgi:hypothetical protein